jgi:hypothetical protein
MAIAAAKIPYLYDTRFIRVSQQTRFVLLDIFITVLLQ